MLSLIDWLIACANSSDDHGVHQWSPNGGPEGSNRLASHVWPGCGAPPLHWGRPPSQRLWHSNSESANGRKLFSGNHPYHLSSAFFFIKLSLLGTYICMLKYATIVLHCFLLFMIKAGVEADLKVLVWNKVDTDLYSTIIGSDAWSFWVQFFNNHNRMLDPLHAYHW
jgi:hypothetical protein